MAVAPELRKSPRVQIENRVRVLSQGRLVASVVAVNLSLGGILLNAQSRLPVGSVCEVSILPLDGTSSQAVSVPGTVIREDGSGTAVRFSTVLPRDRFQVLAASLVPGAGGIISAYRAYFQVCKSADLAHCESLLGVTKAQFRRVFYGTFASSILLAVAPVWALRESIPALPNSAKIAMAFLYGAIWLMLLQPSLDLAVFRWLKARRA